MQSTEGRHNGVDVLVLAGAVESDAPWAQGIPRAFLPLSTSTLIESLLQQFHSAFEGACTICANGHAELLVRCLAENRAASNGRTPRLQLDHVPRGTAGCIKACEPHLPGDAVFVAGAAVWLDDDLRWMLEQHRVQGNALTVYCTPGPLRTGGTRCRQLTPVGVYCCDRKVLQHIPRRGYYDVKEQLVPALQKAGLRVGAVPLPGRTCEVSNWSTYVRVLSHELSGQRDGVEGYSEIAPGIWCGEDVKIGGRARIVGPALLGHGCRIDDDATVIGPAILGDQCHVASGAWMIRAVAPPGSSFAPGESVSDTVVPASQAYAGAPSTDEAEAAPARPNAVETAAAEQTPVPTVVKRLLMPAFLLLGAFVWAFSHNIARLWEVWQSNPDYSVGQLVPLAALYMAWTRRRDLASVTLAPSVSGLLVFAVGIAASVFGGYFFYSSVENVGMVLCVNGLVLGMVGWNGYKQICVPLLFLFLMLPLPGQIHDAIMLPLQAFCARLSATVLETVGVPVQRYGHILEVSGHQTAVAEACNGLRMAVAFLIVTCVVAYLINRPKWQKVVVLISSVPIALACNVVRIVVMAYSFGAGYGWLAEGLLHDGFGLLMMPLALSLVFLELAVLSSLALSPVRDAPIDSLGRVPVFSGR